MTPLNYTKLGKQYRRRIIEMALAAGRGHIASAFSLVEILTVLYHRVLRVNPSHPNDASRDRLILSKGHGCMALYAVLADLGFFPAKELDLFCQPEGILGGHPDHRKVPGIEASTGALGHGLSIGIGMAMAARMDRRDYRVYVILGDGECDEGSVWEAALAASHHRLANLVVLIDYNKFQSYGRVSEVLELEPFADKWRSFGFRVQEVEMKEPEMLEKLLLDSSTEGSPLCVICHTVKGAGVSFMENNLAWHHKAKLTPEEKHLLTLELSEDEDKRNS